MGMIYRFGQLFNVVDGDRGKNYPKDCDFSDKGYCLFLNAGNVTKNSWSFENNSFITEEKDQLLHNGRLTRENTVFTTRGTVGNAAYYGKNIPFEHIRINSGMVILSSKDTSLIQNKFIYYLVTSPYAKKTIEMFCSGSAQPQLPIKDFVKIKFNLPSIEHQQKITYILSAYDNLIENNNKRIKILEQMAENLYKEWFVRFRFPNYQNTQIENGIPKGWNVIRLGELCDIVTGKKDANEATGMGKYPFFTCARESNLYTNEYLLDVDAILIAGNGSYTGYVKKYSGRFDLYQRTYALYNFKNVEWLYLYWTMKINFEREFMGGSRGSAIPYITKPNISKYKILLPSKELLKKSQEIFDLIYKKCCLLEQTNQNLIKQRDMLLPRLMSGKLEV